MHKENKKDRIITEAIKLFSTYSYDSVSMTDIADKVGVTKAALYYHFKNKEELFEYIIDRSRKEVLSTVRDILEDDHLSLHDKLYKCVFIYSSFLQKNHGILGLWFSRQTKHIHQFIKKSDEYHKHFYNLSKSLSESIISDQKLGDLYTHEDITTIIMSLTLSLSKPTGCTTHTHYTPDHIAQKVVSILIR